MQVPYRVVQGSPVGGQPEPGLSSGPGGCSVCQDALTIWDCSLSISLAAVALHLPAVPPVHSATCPQCHLPGPGGRLSPRSFFAMDAAACGWSLGHLPLGVQHMGSMKGNLLHLHGKF